MKKHQNHYCNMKSTLKKNQIINEGWTFYPSKNKVKIIYFKKDGFNISTSCINDPITQLLITVKGNENNKSLYGPLGNPVVYNGGIKSIEQFKLLIEIIEQK